MGLTSYFIVHASCFSVKDSKRGVCRTREKLAGVTFYLSEIDREDNGTLLSILWRMGRLGYDTYFGGFFSSSALQQVQSLACHDTT